MVHGPLVKLIIELPRENGCLLVAVQERHSRRGDTHDREIITILSTIRELPIYIPVWCWISIDNEGLAVEGIARVHQSVTVKLRNRMCVHINGEGWREPQSHCAGGKDWGKDD